VSWRHHASDAQDVILDTFAERDDADAFTTQLDTGSGPPADLRLIFFDGHLEILEALENPASTREIRGDCAIAELPAYPPTKAWRILIRRPLEGDPLDSAGPPTRFLIRDHAPDGEGLVRFFLQRERAPASP